MHRLLERIDGAASTLVPLAYLAGMLISASHQAGGMVTHIPDVRERHPQQTSGAL
jgi:hypothetical protein